MLRLQQKVKVLVLCVFLISCSKKSKLQLSKIVEEDSSSKTKIIEFNCPIGFYLNENFHPCLKSFFLKFKKEKRSVSIYNSINLDSNLKTLSKQIGHVQQIQINLNNKDTELLINYIGANKYKFTFKDIKNKKSCPFIYDGLTLYINEELEILGAYLFLSKNQIYEEDINRYIYYPVGDIYEDFEINDYKLILSNDKKFKLHPAVP